MFFSETKQRSSESVIFSMKGNIYELNLMETWELFHAYAQGNPQALVAVVSQEPLDTRAQQALDSSAEQFGYGKNACLFLSLQAYDTQVAPAANYLDAHALFAAIEGFDPLCIVVADARATRILQEAYKCEVRTQAVGRVFGRSVVAFVDFSRMLQNPQDKQCAWGLLKQLPRKGSST